MAFQFIGKKTYHGEFSRYALQECRDRFGNTVWFLTDAETIDDCGLPAVVKQVSTRDEALAMFRVNQQ